MEGIPEREPPPPVLLFSFVIILFMVEVFSNGVEGFSSGEARSDKAGDASGGSNVPRLKGARMVVVSCQHKLAVGAEHIEARERGIMWKCENEKMG